MDPHADYLVTHQWMEVVAAYRRSDGRCGLCGQPVDLKVMKGREQPSIDHIIPLSRGGLDERCNTQLAHCGCNSKKGNRGRYPEPARTVLTLSLEIDDGSGSK